MRLLHDGHRNLSSSSYSLCTALVLYSLSDVLRILHIYTHIHRIPTLVTSRIFCVLEELFFKEHCSAHLFSCLRVLTWL